MNPQGQQWQYGPDNHSVNQLYNNAGPPAGQLPQTGYVSPQNIHPQSSAPFAQGMHEQNGYLSQPFTRPGFHTAPMYTNPGYRQWNNHSPPSTGSNFHMPQMHPNMGLHQPYHGGIGGDLPGGRPFGNQPPHNVMGGQLQHPFNTFSNQPNSDSFSQPTSQQPSYQSFASSNYTQSQPNHQHQPSSYRSVRSSTQSQPHPYRQPAYNQMHQRRMQFANASKGSAQVQVNAEVKMQTMDKSEDEASTDAGGPKTAATMEAAASVVGSGVDVQSSEETGRYEDEEQDDDATEASLPVRAKRNRGATRRLNEKNRKAQMRKNNAEDLDTKHFPGPALPDPALPPTRNAMKRLDRNNKELQASQTIAKDEEERNTDSNLTVRPAALSSGSVSNRGEGLREDAQTEPISESEQCPGIHELDGGGAEEVEVLEPVVSLPDHETNGIIGRSTLHTESPNCYYNPDTFLNGGIAIFDPYADGPPEILTVQFPGHYWHSREKDFSEEYHQESSSRRITAKILELPRPQRIALFKGALLEAHIQYPEVIQAVMFDNGYHHDMTRFNTFKGEIEWPFRRIMSRFPQSINLPQKPLILHWLEVLQENKKVTAAAAMDPYAPKEAPTDKRSILVRSGVSGDSSAHRYGEEYVEYVYPFIEEAEEEIIPVNYVATQEYAEPFINENEPIKKMEARLQKTIDNAAVLARHYMKRDAELQAALAEINKLNSELQTLQSSKILVDNEKAEKDSEIRAVKGEVNKLNSELQSLQSAKTLVDNEVAENATKYEELKVINESLSTKLCKKTAENRKSQGQLENLTQMLPESITYIPSTPSISFSTRMSNVWTMLSFSQRNKKILNILISFLFSVLIAYAAFNYFYYQTPSPALPARELPGPSASSLTPSSTSPPLIYEIQVATVMIQSEPTPVISETCPVPTGDGWNFSACVTSRSPAPVEAPPPDAPSTESTLVSASVLTRLDQLASRILGPKYPYIVGAGVVGGGIQYKMGGWPFRP